VPTLNVEEYQFSDTGVVLNGDSNSLPFTDVTSVEGLDMAPFRTQQHDREGVDGGYVDAEFETIRTITIEGQVYAAVSSTEDYLDRLKANFAPTRTPQPFYFQTDKGQRVVYGKSAGFSYPKDQNRRLGIFNFQVQILCEDPRIYDPNPITTTTQLQATPTVGRSFSKSYPFAYGAAVGNSSSQIVMGGNRPTPALLQINGPVVNPTIVNNDTGTTMKFNISLANGEYLLINLGNRSVLKNGTTPARSTMTLIGTWYMLQPGPNNFTFGGTQSPPTPVATLTITAYSAWR
jgi:hypothetical protein